MPLTPLAQEMLAKGTPVSVDFAAFDPLELAKMMRATPFARPEIAERAAVEDIVIPGPKRGIPARIYRPNLPAPLPVVVNFHGGGWVMGTLDMDDLRCHHLALNAGVAVISIDYCLAPEHPFPAPLEECYAATVWISCNAGKLGVDAERLAVSGGSAGGNLAAAVALAARDRNGPAIRFQLLNYPAVDTDVTRPSYVENGEGYGLTTVSMHWFFDQYLPIPSMRFDPYAMPIHEKDLSGLPPGLVITAEYDVLRDEGEAYAMKLREAGNDVSYIRYDGVPHGFLTLMPDSPESRQAMDEGATAMRRALL
jgi:acetyl esterase